MASFCSMNTSTDHSTDWDAPYSGSNSIVAAVGNSSVSRDQNGLIPDSAIPGLVQSLTSRNIVPAVPPTTPNAAELEAFLTKNTAFIEGAKAEYC